MFSIIDTYLQWLGLMILSGLSAVDSLPYTWPLGVMGTLCTFQILGGCQGQRTGVGVTTVSNSLILGGWVTKVLNNGHKK